MSDYLKRIKAVTKSYSNFIKSAFDANEDKVKVKKIIEAFLKKLANSPGGEGILYPSNVSVESKVDYVHVSFIANLDVAKYEELLDKESERQNKYQTELVPQLAKYFALPVKLTVQTIYDKDPGWFGKKFD